MIHEYLVVGFGFGFGVCLVAIFDWLCPDWCGKEKWRILPED
jgi:hypothetical protein